VKRGGGRTGSERRGVSGWRTGVASADVFDELAIGGDGGDLERLDRVFDAVVDLGAALFAEEGRGDDLGDGGDACKRNGLVSTRIEGSARGRTVHLITENVLEHLRFGIEKSVEKDVLRLSVLALVDDAHDRLRSELVGTEMREVRGETRSEKGVALGHSGGFEEPSDEESAVRTGGERDGVEDDGGSDAFLWVVKRVNGGDCAKEKGRTNDLKTRSSRVLEGLTSRTSAEPSRSNLPASHEAPQWGREKGRKRENRTRCGRPSSRTRSRREETRNEALLGRHSCRLRSLPIVSSMRETERK
jgi:hypothetical protein